MTPGLYERFRYWRALGYSARAACLAARCQEAPRFHHASDLRTDDRGGMVLSW